MTPFDANLFKFAPAKTPDQLHPLVLAYVGDAVYEVVVRQYVVSRTNHRPNHLHRESVKYVSAKNQARILETWVPHLTPEEADIVRRGRNAKSGSVPRNADVADYRQSTAMECLIGYLYYTGQLERLNALFDMIWEPEG